MFLLHFILFSSSSFDRSCIVQLKVFISLGYNCRFIIRHSNLVINLFVSSVVHCKLGKFGIVVVTKIFEITMKN